jgi:cytoskeleton protein RodZ
MGELGQLLRQTREEKGITLDQVAHETRIRARFLEALEQEDYEALPTPGHVHGFLRNYTLYLGLDLSEVQALYDAENKPSRFVPGIFRPKDIDLAPPRRPLVRASVALGIVLFLVVLVVGGWALWQYGMPVLQPLLQPIVEPVVQPVLQWLTPAAERTAAAASADAATAEAATAEARAVEAATATQAAATSAALATATKTPTEVVVTATPTAVPTETPIPTATPEQPSLSPTSTPDPTKTPTPTLTPTPSPTPVEGVTLSIRVIERAWLQVTLDGLEQPGELLEVDEERTWEAEQSIYFICGNAGGVMVTVNGDELGALGRRAEVVERTWTPQGEATPTPAPS